MSTLHATPDAAKPVDETFFAALGVRRLSVPVPFVEAGGPVNLIAFDEADGGFSLFDTGVGTTEGLAAVRAALAANGLKLENLRRMIISHGHIDHYGNAQTFSEESGAKAWVHPADHEKVCGEGRWNKQLERYWDYFVGLGVPDETLQKMLHLTAKNPTYARQLEPSRVEPLADGQTFSFAKLEVEAIHLPGHTPGLVCLWAKKQKLFFADDHVLAVVSPNPLLDLTQGLGAQKFRALSSYYRSARRVMEMDIEVIVPGHGVSFTQHRPLLEGLFQFYEKRQERLFKKLSETPSTVFELVKLLFPRVDTARMFLMLSEVLGNLEVMEDQGRVAPKQDGKFVRWAALP